MFCRSERQRKEHVVGKFYRYCLGEALRKLYCRPCCFFFFFVIDYDVFYAATFTHKDDRARNSTRQAVRRFDGETPERAPVNGRRGGG